ncbi:hypothetical protein [Cryptosporangium minutisporangium]
MSRARLGWLLLAPGFVALLWTYLIPTGTTLGNSVWRQPAGSEWRLTPSGTAERVEPLEGRLNLGNIEYVLSSSYPEQLGRSVLLAVVPLVLTLLVAPLLAMAAQRTGRGGRLFTRVLISVPLAGYAPVAYLIAWTFGNTDGRVDRDPSPLVAAAVCSPGPVLAVAVTLYLAAFRRTGARPGRGPRERAAYVVGGVLALAVLAVAIQSFTARHVAGGAQVPRRGPTGLLPAAVQASTHLQPVLSTMMLVPLAALGLLAMWLLLAARTRIDLAPPSLPDRRHPGWWLVLIVALVLFAAVVVVAALPWLRTLDDDPGAGDFSAAEIYRDTWLPPLLSAVVSVLVAAGSGYALGVLRPLGERSTSLLWLFAPWLFVGVGPLAFAYRDRAEGAQQADTWFDLVPPVWISIPALVVFTLFFRARRADTAPVRSALPLIGLAVLAHWMLGAQDLLWPGLVGDNLAAPVLAFGTAALGQSLELTLGLGMILPLPVFLVLFALVVTAQVGYLDRLTIRTGHGSEERTSPDGPGPAEFRPSARGSGP